jgi:mRNA interferase MazF
VACPITNTRKGWGSHLPLMGTETLGFVMIEQVRSLDWRARGARFVERAPAALCAEVRAALAVMLGLS